MTSGLIDTQKFVDRVAEPDHFGTDPDSAFYFKYRSVWIRILQ
jgi:predicted exporter